MPELTPQQYNQLIQQGLDENTIKNIASQRGYTLPGQGPRGFLTGAVKGAIGDIARPTAQALQGLGQRTLAAVTPMTLNEVRGTTGFRSLDDRTLEGQRVVQSLQTQGPAEKAGRVAANIASFFIPTSAGGQFVGRALASTGKGLVSTGIGLTTKEAPLVQAYKARFPVSQRIAAALKGTTLGNKPITNAETVINQKLWGSENMIGIQAKRAADKIWKDVITPGLQTSKAKIDMRSFIKELQQEVNKIPELGRRGELKDALAAFANDYRKVGNISLPKLQQYKEGWAKFLPDKVYKGKPVASSFREIQDMAASLARNKIYKELGDEGKAAYFDYGNLKNLQELGQAGMTGTKFRGGTGTLLSGLRDALLTPVATGAGIALYKAGKGLEFIGAPGAKIIGDLFK